MWLLAGIALLGVTLLDVLLTALNVDEAGFVAGQLTRLQWDLIRRPPAACRGVATGRASPALQTALRGSRPGDLELDPRRVGPDVGQASPEVEQALHEVDRINQILRVVVDNVSPCSRDEAEEAREQSG